MQEQIIQRFLNLSGIVGLALLDGHSRPYFCGVDKSLNFQQREALSQGIQQVISTTPASFEAFDFRFSQHDVRIYKLSSSIILVVITSEDLDIAAYERLILQLKQALQADPHSAVSTFRILAGSTTLSKQYWSNGQPAATLNIPGGFEVPVSTHEFLVNSPAPELYRWEQVIAALNALTDASAQYLGKIVVANTWRSTRPKDEALNTLKLDRSGHFSCAPEANIDHGALIKPNDYDRLCYWVQKFIARCSLIILDFPNMVVRQALSDQQRYLLGIDPA